jgi:hypothetical protein
LQECPNWLTTEVVLSEFGTERGKAPEALDDFVREGVSRELEKVLESHRWPALLGKRDFLSHIRDRFVKGKKHDPEKPQEKELLRNHSPEEVLEKDAKA